MILIVIIILLLLYRLYPEYEIYILLSGLLFLLYSNQIECFQNQIDISREWDEEITSPTMDNEHIKIKLSDDPVRNCYYKIKDSNECRPFPSSPSMFNINPDERFSPPGERKPLFFDFISPGSDKTQLYDSDDNTIKIKSNVNYRGSDSIINPGFSLSPIHKNQYGMDRNGVSVDVSLSDGQGDGGTRHSEGSRRLGTPRHAHESHLGAAARAEELD